MRLKVVSVMPSHYWSRILGSSLAGISSLQELQVDPVVRQMDTQWKRP